MTTHTCKQITSGCYRCDLNLDEMRDFLRDVFIDGATEGADPDYDDRDEAGEAFDETLKALIEQVRQEAVAGLARDVEALTRQESGQGRPDVSCGGYFITDDGCHAGMLAQQILEVLAKHSGGAA